MGRKGAKASKIVNALPAGNRLIDAFGGGGCVTLHAADSGKYDQVLFNDLSPNAYKLFDEIIVKHHKVDPEKLAMTTREQFFSVRDKKPEDMTLEDTVVLMCFSFGFNMKDYLYSKKLEPIKLLLTRALLCGDTDTQFDSLYESTKGLETLREKYRAYKKQIKTSPIDRLQNIERLKQVESLQQDYRHLDINPDDIVYCDPPYRDAKQYADVPDWNSEAFTEWYMSCPAKNIYISEYSVLPGTEVVANLGRRRTVFTSTAKKHDELLLRVIK